MKKIYLFTLLILFSTVSFSQRIYIDPGHGYGASVSDNPDGRTATEIETNLEVGLKLKNLLTNNCSTVTVLMSRTTNINGWSNVSNRALQAQNWNADRLISIHCNADGDSSNDASATSTATGTETFYSTATKTTANTQSASVHLAYATIMNSELALKGSMYKRNSGNPYLRDNLGIFGRSTTACLNEIGFVDNINDKNKLLDDSWRNQFALGYYTALKSNLNISCNTSAPVPGSFTLTVTPSCSGTTSVVTLTWTSSANATSYDIYRNGSLYTSNITGTTFTNTAVTANTTYSYSIKAKNASTTQTSNSNGAISTTTLNCSSPGAFTLTATPECNGSTSRINLTWTAASNASSYDIYRNGALYASNITSTQFLNTYITVGTTYAYYVKAKNNIGSINNSNGSLSRTALTCAPGDFTITATATCSGSTSAINITWTVSANATSYDIYRNGNLYASDLTGTSFLNTYQIVSGTTYTYYVKAKNSVGTLNNSNGNRSVTAISCVAKTNNSSSTFERSDIMLYPNPTQNQFNIVIQNALKQEINISIYDTNGKIILENNSFSEDQEFSKTLDISKLSNGVYLVLMRIGNQEITKHFIKN